MNILFVTGEYPPLHGGVGAYTACLADALQQCGVTVSILTAPAAANQFATTPSAEQSTGRPITPIWGQRRWGPTIWQTIPRLARTIGADWIHVQYQTAAFAMNPAINLAPMIWQRRAVTPQIAWTYHDLLPPYLFPKAGATLRRWVTAQPAHNSDLVIATNEADRLQLRTEEQVDALKIPIGSNITPPQWTTDIRSTQRTVRGYSAEQFVLGYFGFLNRSKGGLTLIHTLDRLVQNGYDAHLLMIGERVGASDPTNYAYLQEVESLISSLNLAERVRWTGHQDDDAVSKDLMAIDILLMPYLDGASLRRGTLMAGLAHGCPIVTTTPQGPLPELVHERDLLFVPPEDPLAASDAVARLICDQTFRHQLGERAQRQSTAFTWAAIAQRHLTHYDGAKA